MIGKALQNEYTNELISRKMINGIAMCRNKTR